MVFDRLREANLRLGPRKCTLAKRSVTFLGHHVSVCRRAKTRPQTVRKYKKYTNPHHCDPGEIFPRPGRLPP